MIKARHMSFKDPVKIVGFDGQFVIIIRPDGLLSRMIYEGFYDVDKETTAPSHTLDDLLKPLEWITPNHGVDLKRAHTIIGKYRVWPLSPNGQSYWKWCLDEGIETVIGMAKSEESAKAIVFEDYKVRILSAFQDK